MGSTPDVMKVKKGEKKNTERQKVYQEGAVDAALERDQRCE